MAYDHANGRHLCFVHSQFDAAIEQIREHPQFKASMKSVQGGKSKGHDVAVVLTKAHVCYHLKVWRNNFNVLHRSGKLFLQ